MRAGAPGIKEHRAGPLVGIGQEEGGVRTSGESGAALSQISGLSKKFMRMMGKAKLESLGTMALGVVSTGQSLLSLWGGSRTVSNLLTEFRSSGQN